MSQHRRARLDQDVVARKVRALLGDIHILARDGSEMAVQLISRDLGSFKGLSDGEASSRMTAAVKAANNAIFERTLSELARALETSWPAAKRLEDPTHWPSLKTLERAAAALGKRLVLTLE